VSPSVTTDVLAIDVGQTGLRLRLGDGEVIEGALGVVALTSTARVDALVENIVAHVPDGLRPAKVGVGLSGFVSGSDAPMRVASQLHERLGAHTVSVAADAVTAYLGTVGDRAGTVVISGTGVAGLGSDGIARHRRVDARGYLLGDFGGGFWIGQRGLQAALDAIEQRGEPTALGRLSAELGAPSDIYLAAMASTPAPAYVAAFAPHVLAAAGDGDAVAERILRDAATQIARTISAASLAEGPIGLTGGLARSGIYTDAVAVALRSAGLDAASLIVRPDAALHGAGMLAVHDRAQTMFTGLIATKEPS
jgi:N-acetylglucosamine kinase-like BadF-type ATPase